MTAEYTVPVPTADEKEINMRWQLLNLTYMKPTTHNGANTAIDEAKMLYEYLTGKACEPKTK